MITDTAAHAPLMEQICWRILTDDFSVKAANWYHCDFSHSGVLLRLPGTVAASGSRGAQARITDWYSKWAAHTQESSAPRADFIARTELARKLWALREKYIAEGGKLYKLAEIQEEVARRRGELE